MSIFQYVPDEPPDWAWVAGPGGWQWASDRYLLLRADAPRPYICAGPQWMRGTDLPTGAVDAVTVKRVECLPELIPPYEIPDLPSLVHRYAPLYAAGERVFTPRVGLHEGNQIPCIAMFFPGDELPFAVIATALRPPETSLLEDLIKCAPTQAERRQEDDGEVG